MKQIILIIKPFLDRNNLVKVIEKNINTYYTYFFIASISIVLSILTFSIVLAASISDSFINETYIGGKVGQETSGVVGVNGTAPFGGITIAPCYTPNVQWNFVDTTIVRDVSSTSSSSTVQKDVYCDGSTVTTDSNCILWTHGATAPSTVCIATNSNVYENLLWRGGDIESLLTWATSSNQTTLITGGDIGGTHTTNTGGLNNYSITGNNWLERYYTSTPGTYPAMDACKALGLGWRMPNILEFDGIRDMTTGVAPYTKLPNLNNTHWSSSEDLTDTGGEGYGAWTLSLGVGNIGDGNGFNKAFALYVRCVRGY